MTKRETPVEKEVRKPRKRVAFPLPSAPRLRQSNDSQRLQGVLMVSDSSF